MPDSHMPHASDSSESNHTRAHRVIASLNRDQVDFLDKIGKDALFSCGTKLSRTHILAAMVNAMRRLRLTGEGVSTPEQFEERIVATIAMLRIRGGRHHG